MAAAKENYCYCKNDVGRLLFMVDGFDEFKGIQISAKANYLSL